VSKHLIIKNKEAVSIVERGIEYVEVMVDGELVKMMTRNGSKENAEEIGRQVMKAITEKNYGFFEDMAKLVKKRVRTDSEVDNIDAHRIYQNYRNCTGDLRGVLFAVPDSEFKFASLLKWAKESGQDLSRFEIGGDWERRLEKRIKKIREDIADGKDYRTRVKLVD